MKNWLLKGGLVQGLVFCENGLTITLTLTVPGGKKRKKNNKLLYNTCLPMQFPMDVAKHTYRRKNHRLRKHSIHTSYHYYQSIITITIQQWMNNSCIYVFQFSIEIVSGVCCWYSYLWTLSLLQFNWQYKENCQQTAVSLYSQFCTIIFFQGSVHFLQTLYSEATLRLPSTYRDHPYEISLSH